MMDLTLVRSLMREMIVSISQFCFQMSTAEDSSSSSKLILKGSGGVIFQGAKCEGMITLGEGTIIHPGAEIKATNGEIIFGDFNIVEEYAVIENKNDDGSPMIIGNDNVFSVRSKCFSKSVGNFNVIGFFSVIGKDSEISDNCFIGPYGTYYDKKPMPKGLVIFNGNQRRISEEQGPISNRLQCERQKKQLVSFHRFITPKPAVVDG